MNYRRVHSERVYIGTNNMVALIWTDNYISSYEGPIVKINKYTYIHMYEYVLYIFTCALTTLLSSFNQSGASFNLSNVHNLCLQWTVSNLCHCAKTTRNRSQISANNAADKPLTPEPNWAESLPNAGGWKSQRPTCMHMSRHAGKLPSSVPCELIIRCCCQKINFCADIQHKGGAKR